MNLNKNAFTLIELLVAVLIIGILAAVALPQYWKAVARSRAIEGLIFSKAIKDAQERYFLANGKYTSDFTQLDISFDGVISNSSATNDKLSTSHFDAYLRVGENTYVGVYVHYNNKITIERYYDKSPTRAGELFCYAGDVYDESRAKACKDAGFTKQNGSIFTYPD